MDNFIMNKNSSFDKVLLEKTFDQFDQFDQYKFMQ